jgi:hypothetical protein
MTTKELRRNQGELGKQIGSLRRAMKEAFKNKDKEGWRWIYPLLQLTIEFRCKHIGYSLARGRKYEDIEKPKKGNIPRKDLVQLARKEYEQAREEGRKAYEVRKNENVCTCA